VPGARHKRSIARPMDNARTLTSVGGGGGNSESSSAIRVIQQLKMDILQRVSGWDDGASSPAQAYLAIPDQFIVNRHQRGRDEPVVVHFLSPLRRIDLAPIGHAPVKISCHKSRPNQAI
jgi:hypothetical protein